MAVGVVGRVEIVAPVEEEEVAVAPSRSMRLRNCLGMIWSVSMLGIGSGTAVEVRTLIGIMMVGLARAFSAGLQPAGAVWFTLGFAPGCGSTRLQHVGAAASSGALSSVCHVVGSGLLKGPVR